MNTVIRAEGISKNFGGTQALGNISFSANEGEILGIIGPDGAGKTTLFRIITTLILPDSGSLEIFGLNALKSFKEIRKHTGYMPGRFSLYPDLTVEENLNFYATVFDTTIEENYHLISGIFKHLEPFRKRAAGKLSGGMKQKLALSCALIHKPRLLVLDEPTTGVDAVSRVEFWEILSKLKEYNITILVSTPYMDEAMKCDRVVLIQQGKILAIDTPENIVKSFSVRLFKIRATDKFNLINTVRRHPCTRSAYPFGDSLHVSFKDDSIPADLNDYLKVNGIEKAEIIGAEPCIEDCFLELMKK